MTKLNIILSKFLLKNLFWFLMNESADCMNALIEEANISKLINSHHSILFVRDTFIIRKDLLHPLYLQIVESRIYHFMIFLISWLFMFSFCDLFESITYGPESQNSTHQRNNSWNSLLEYTSPKQIKLSDSFEFVWIHMNSLMNQWSKMIYASREIYLMISHSFCECWTFCTLHFAFCILHFALNERIWYRWHFILADSTWPKDFESLIRLIDSLSSIICENIN
jgi:hypothetical protein